MKHEHDLVLANELMEVELLPYRFKKLTFQGLAFRQSE